MIPITEETRKRIEYGLAHWHDSDSEARQRFERSKVEWDKKHQHITDAIEASERLTEQDFTFRVRNVHVGA